MNADIAPQIMLHLLRGFAVNIHCQRVVIGPASQRLLAFLALQDRPLARNYVAWSLWPDTTSLKASANLRSSLWRVQAVCDQLVETSAQQLMLAPRVAVDLRAAKARAHRLLEPDAGCVDLLTTAVCSDLSSDLLPDWYDEWVVVEREKYHQLRLHALEAMCGRLTAAGRHGEAIEAGLTAVRAEPLRESAYLVLIKAHLASGNRWDAVRQFERCRDLLHAELGLEPSAELRFLIPAASAAAG
jgi:DNA-binding SARP family transcriptional activator